MSRRKKWPRPPPAPPPGDDVLPIGTRLLDPCPDCGGPMLLVRSVYGLFYGCARFPKCRATHGAHPDGRPLGKPADAPTRAARIRAHAALDRLWKGPSAHMDRAAAYIWMRHALGLPDDRAHIGLFGADDCARLVKAVEEYLGVSLAVPGQALVALGRFHGLGDETD